MMFNICKEAANGANRPKLEGIIQDYIKANQECESQFLQHVQQSENAFFNHWKALNALRIQTQAQNWAKFMNQLQQITSKPSAAMSSGLGKQLFPSINSTSGAVTNSMAPLPMKMNERDANALRQSRRVKANEEYKCLRPDCAKIYSTKGNLNRHLKDHHEAAVTANGSEIKMECDECSQSFSDSDSLEKHQREMHYEKRKALKHDTSPPRKPTPPQTTCPVPPSTVTASVSNAFTIGDSNHMLRTLLNNAQANANQNPFSAQTASQMMPKFPTLINMNNKNKALHLPVFNFNSTHHAARSRSLNAKLSSIKNVNPFAISNTNNKSNANTVLQVLAANNLPNGNGAGASSVDQNKNENKNKKSNNVQQQHGVNSFSAMPEFMNDEKAERVNNNNHNKQRYAYNAIDILLQAAESLEKKKCDSVSSNTSSDTEDDRVRRTVTAYPVPSASRKRKKGNIDDIDEDPTYDPEQDRNPAKRRKLNKEIINEEVRARIEVDYKKGVCRLCKKTQREKNTSNYNWKNHLASDHKYPCTKCEDRFTKPKYLDIHMAKSHTAPKSMKKQKKSGD